MSLNFPRGKKAKTMDLYNMTRTLVIALMATTMLSAQTRVTPTNLTGTPAPTGRVWVVLPSGALAEAGLVGIVLEFDPASGRPVLRAVQPPVPKPPPVLVDRGIGMKLPADEPAAATYTLPETPVSLNVYLNGLLQFEGEDYTLADRVVTWTKTKPNPGDLVQYHYRTMQPGGN